MTPGVGASGTQYPGDGVPTPPSLLFLSTSTSPFFPHPFPLTLGRHKVEALCPCASRGITPCSSSPLHPHQARHRVRRRTKQNPHTPPKAAHKPEHANKATHSNKTDLVPLENAAHSTTRGSKQWTSPLSMQNCTTTTKQLPQPRTHDGTKEHKTKTRHFFRKQTSKGLSVKTPVTERARDRT